MCIVDMKNLELAGPQTVHFVVICPVLQQQCHSTINYFIASTKKLSNCLKVS